MGTALPLGSSAAACAEAVSGVCVALDMTLRDAQWEAKDAGKPWTIAKAFDGSCPVSEVVPVDGLDLAAQTVFCEVDGVEKQRGLVRCARRDPQSAALWVQGTQDNPEGALERKHRPGWTELVMIDGDGRRATH